MTYTHDNDSLAEQLRYTASKYIEINAEERCAMWEAAWVLNRQDKFIAFITGAKPTSSPSP